MGNVNYVTDPDDALTARSAHRHIFFLHSIRSFGTILPIMIGQCIYALAVHRCTLLSERKLFLPQQKTG